MNAFNSRPLSYVALLAVAMAAGWLASGRATGAQTQDRPTRIAVANIARIVNDMRETRDLDERFNADRDKLAQEEARMKEQIKNLEGQAGNFRTDSPQYEDLQNQYIEAVAKFKVWGESVTFKRDAQKKRLTRSLYEKAQAAVGEYAAREGFDVVINDVQPTISDKDLAQIQLKDVGAVLNQRRVVYASKSTDISQAIIALLDSKYRGEGAVGAVGGGGAPAGNVTTAPAGVNTGAATTEARPAGDSRPAGQQGGQGAPRRPTNR